MDWESPDSDTWIALSARLQRFIAGRSGHTEVIVRIGPVETDPATTWPSGYRPLIAEVLIDARRVLQPHDDPDAIDMLAAEDRAAFPALTGWACLAAAHVAHTTWPVEAALEGAEASVGRSLEQGRACVQYLPGHAADRRWLRAAVRSLFAEEGHHDYLGLLTMARAGVLLDFEVASIREAYERTLGESVMQEVTDLIDEALGLEDDAVDRLVVISSEITALLGLIAPDADPDLARAVNETMRETSARAVPRPSPLDAGIADERAVAADFRIGDEFAARSTFGKDPDRIAVTRREPDAQMRLRARELVDSLRRARFRAPSIDVVPSELPPGRLRLAEAMRREAQRAAHARPTAKPWRQLRRRPQEQPRLRVGLSWDISRSRAAFQTEMADLAWALAWAVSRVNGEIAAVAWNSTTVPVVWPGTAPAQIVEPMCSGGSSACPQSLRALSGVLRLDDPTHARLVVVMTDGQIGNRRFVQLEVDRLRERGVPVMWLTPGVDHAAPRGVRAYPVLHGEELAPRLGQALVALLQEHYDSREFA